MLILSVPGPHPVGDKPDVPCGPGAVPARTAGLALPRPADPRAAKRFLCLGPGGGLASPGTDKKGPPLGGR